MPERIGANSTQDEVSELALAAAALLAPESLPEKTGDTLSLEDCLRQANDMVGADLHTIKHLKHLNIEPDYTDLFKERMNEKIAALIFLTEQKLLELSIGASAEAHQDMALYVEILFRLNAADALVIIYDYAYSHEGEDPSSTFWKNVGSRGLYLLSLLTSSRERVLSFIAERPAAYRRLEELSKSPNAEIARAAGDLLQASIQASSNASQVAFAPFVSIYLREYANIGKEPAEEKAVPAGAISEKITAAIQRSDIAQVSEMIIYGKDAEVRETIMTARSAAIPEMYLDILERVLLTRRVDPVRKAAAVLELGRINRASGFSEGMLRVNRLLQVAANSNESNCVLASRLAVRELASVNAIMDIERIVEEAAFVPVAEEAILALKNARVLSTHLNYLEKRPELRPAYLAARNEIMEVRHLMEAAFASSSEQIAMTYLTRLQAMNGYPEIRKLSLNNSVAGRLAQKIVSEMNADI